MGRGLGKVKTKVINVITNEEFIFESRLAAAKFTGIERKRLNGYMQKGIVYNKTFKFIDMED